MKLVYEPGEKERIREIYEHNTNFRLFSGGDKKYSLSFEVTDPALAQYMLPALLNDRMPDIDLGINITSINFGQLHDAETIKSQLHQAIDEIFR